jgi:hypothetical protein
VTAPVLYLGVSVLSGGLLARVFYDPADPTQAVVERSAPVLKPGTRS